MFTAFQSNAFQRNAFQINGQAPSTGGGGLNRLVLKKKYLKKYPEIEEQVEAVLPVIEASAEIDYSILNKFLMDANRRAKYFAQLEDDDETFFILD